MRIKQLILFLILYGCLVFFILVNISVFWFIVAGIVSFAYYVAIKNILRDEIEKEFRLKKEVQDETTGQN